MTKTIKGIDKDTWTEFKTIANKNKMNLSTCFKLMVKEHKNVNERVWRDILSTKPILSEKDAENMLEHITRTRNEKGFRE